MKSRTLKLALIPIIVLVCGSAAFFFLPKSGAQKQNAPEYKTGAISRGDIEELVSSNGNLNAVGTVAVLTQVTGTLEKVFVDFNDRVKKDQPLAQINTEKLKIALKEAQASLEKAQAQHEYDQAEYNKSKSLSERSLISESDLAAKKLSYLSSKASLTQAEAAYDEARINIDQYAIILSPIDGIVLERDVDPGQTVVGSGSTNTELFTLAPSLGVMDIKASVDELDISKIKTGQEVRFTVETYSNRKFTGKVRQIRVVPSSSDNVVSYVVMISADNKDGALLPGMTATVEFLVSQKKDVVLVPNAALRFTPSEAVQSAARLKAFEERIKDLPDDQKKAALEQFQQRMKSAKTGSSNSLLGGGAPMGGPMGGPPPGAAGPGGRPGTAGPGGAPGSTAATTAAASNRKTIWLLEADGSVAFKPVTIGASNGTSTEILDGDGLVGKTVITGSK